MGRNRDTMNIEDRDELDALMMIVYEQLRKSASRALEKENVGHTLQTTALVHEAYLRLAELNQIDWENEDHVLKAAAGVMRRVLIDFARKRKAKKRDQSQLLLSCPVGMFAEHQLPPDLDVLALDDALTKLRAFDSLKAELVELRYFGGQNLEDVGRILGVSLSTVKRHWAFSRAWLFRELSI